MPKNALLVPQPGNQWGRDKEIAPFFAFPSWWRRFAFHVLGARTITVYLYLCSLMDPNSICYPSLEQISEDLGITKQPIRDAIKELEQYGFILIGAEPYNGRIIGKRTIYQRPTPHFTIKALLERDVIDADLFPTRIKVRDPKVARSSQDVVAAGLRRLLGATYFAAYDYQENPAQRKEVLIRALQVRIDELMRTIALGTDAPRRTKQLPDLAKLPPALREAAQPSDVPF